MFGRVDKEDTTRRQRVDKALQDKAIETEIKACQRENGECMKSTSNRLREQYSDEQVTTILNRLRIRRYRGNKYQEKGIMNILENLKIFLRFIRKYVVRHTRIIFLSSLKYS